MPEEAAVDTVSMQVRSKLRELVLPLREQEAEIDKRLVSINRERDDLMAAKKEIRKTIEHLEPSQAKANGAGVNADISYAKKKNIVEQYVRTHHAKLADGFTGADIDRQLRAAKIEPVMSATVVLKVLREMHANGEIRADKIVKGGAQLYVVVGK